MYRVEHIVQSIKCVLEAMCTWYNVTTVLLLWFLFAKIVQTPDLRVDTMITKYHVPSGFDHQKTYTHSIFVIFTAFRCILSGFDPNFVKLYQVRFLNYQVHPIVMMFWKVVQKKKRQLWTRQL